jgi:FixJ family two-component response regulator
MGGTPSWIAIVDDDPSVLRALMRLLRTRSFQARTLAQEFLAALFESRPECLILDLQMPEMSGLDLHQHLQLRGIEILTVIITAHDDSDVRQRCAAAGIAAYLVKPLQDTAVFASIAKATGRAG